MKYQFKFIFCLQGKIDAEMQLMTIEEAEQNPAGLGRADPNALPPPK